MSPRPRLVADGHEQKITRLAEDLEEAHALADSADLLWKNLSTSTLKFHHRVRKGKDVTFPVQENIHRNNILSKTIVPARISLVKV